MCAAIAQEAFVASAYPVILSLENHLSPGQQRAAARIFVEELTLTLTRTLARTRTLTPT